VQSLQQERSFGSVIFPFRWSSRLASAGIVSLPDGSMITGLFKVFTCPFWLDFWVRNLLVLGARIPGIG
jgi:hypothetical protein